MGTDLPPVGSVDEALVALLGASLRVAAALGFQLEQTPEGPRLLRINPDADHQEFDPLDLQYVVDSAQAMARRLGVPNFDRFDSIDQIIQRAKDLQVMGNEVMLTAVVDQQTSEVTSFAVGVGQASQVLKSIIMDRQKNTMDPRFDPLDE